MARRKRWATAAIAIAAVLCICAIAQAGNDQGPRWPSIYEPQWPNIPGEPGYRADKPAPVPAPQPEITGSIKSPVDKRWHGVVETKPVSAFTGELGLRYWYSWGKTAKNLYDIAGTSLVSRLAYDGLRGHSGEAFGRLDHDGGLFVKGTLGAGIFTNGHLIDEDFPPFLVPYSSTTSRQRDGHVAYASVDFGFNFIRQPGLRIGAFAGYHYFDQEVNAYGCAQTGSNGAVCGNPLPYDLKVITQNNQWHAVRVGLDANIRLAERLTLRIDGAYLPYLELSGGDSHWLRIGTLPGDFIGQVPEDGQGRGYQLEAALAYSVSPAISFAVGGRYWRMEAHGLTHFEGHVVGVKAFPQKLDWTAETIGVFAQASFKFGPYPAGGFF